MPSTIANKSQERAQFAYAAIAERTKDEINGQFNGGKLSKEEQKEFKSHIKDVPMMIKTNGLAAAFAFVFAKAKRGNIESEKKKEKKDYIAIEDITKTWLVEKQKIYSATPGKTFHEDLLLRTKDEYRLCTREIMALYTWLKRYADGMITD